MEKHNGARDSAEAQGPADASPDQSAAGPWAYIEQKYAVGSRHWGRVTHTMSYGAFVELEPGVEGLVPASEMPWKGGRYHPINFIMRDNELEVEVLRIDKARREIWLAMQPPPRREVRRAPLIQATRAALPPTPPVIPLRTPPQSRGAEPGPPPESSGKRAPGGLAPLGSARGAVAHSRPGSPRATPRGRVP